METACLVLHCNRTAWCLTGPKPHVHLDLTATEEQKRNDVPQIALCAICPTCGTPTEDGFGLAGGGYGPYVFCPVEGCGYFAKMQVEV